MTYGFVAWATPISYSTIVNSNLAEKATALTQALEKTTLAECGPLVDRFILDTGVSILVSDAEGNPVELPNSIAIATASDCLEEEDNVMVFQDGSESAPVEESKTDAGSPSEDTFQVSDELVTVTSDAAPIFLFVSGKRHALYDDGASAVSPLPTRQSKHWARCCLFY